MNNTLNLQDLFSNRIFRVPDYQRGYAWEQQQVGDFLDDLALIGPSRRHYTGTVVLYKPGDTRNREDDEGKTYTEVDVVDGQQRLTTTVLLLNEISRALSRYDSSRSLAEGMKKNYVYRMDDHGQPLHKLSLNEETDQFFKHNILPDTPGVGGATVASGRRLVAAKKQVADYLAEAGGDGANQEQWLRDLHSKITTRLHFNLYEVDSEAEVGVIFEVMNDRGKPLTEMEKLKNYLLYAASTLEIGPDARDDLARKVNSTWADNLKRLTAAGVGSAANEDGLLRADWLVRYDPRPRNWDGVRSIRHRFDLRKGQHTQLLSELHRYVDGLRESCICYCDAHKPVRSDAFGGFTGSSLDEVKRWNRNLVRIGNVATFMPLLIATRMRWPTETEKYLELVRLCEAFAFRMYKLAGAYANYKQSTLFRLAYEVYNGTEFAEAIREMTQRCSDPWVVPTVDRFFSGETSHNRYAWRGLKYFLYEYEEHLAAAKGGSPKVSWMEVINTGAGDTIEHVLPQYIGDRPYWQERFDPATHEEYVHDLGNLALTLGNSSLGTKPFRDKKGEPGADRYCYARSLLVQEQELALSEDWTPETIDQRRAKLLKWARERWHVDMSGVSVGAPVADDEDDDASEDAEEEVA